MAIFKKSPPAAAPVASREPLAPPDDSVRLIGYTSSTRKRLLSDELVENLRNLMPPRVQLYDEWELVYLFEKDGILLNTLYRNLDPQHQRKRQREKGYGDAVVRLMMVVGSTLQDHRRPSGYVLLIEDEHRNVFGAYLNEHLRALDTKRYYGNGECFLWKVERTKRRPTQDGPAIHSSRFKAFPYTGINDNIVFSNPEYIAVGLSQGKNGLWIDRSLYKGISYPCDTFGNEILNGIVGPETKMGSFKIVNLELWRVGSLD